tara:strand:- start:4 stop:1284 length:1281 start_codon:yes stop_codon:yes gene_type:complete
MESIAFDSSIIINLAVPTFFLLIFIEIIYGHFSGKNNYRFNDTFTSISLGLISRFIPLLGIGLQGAAFAYVAAYFNLALFSAADLWVWILAFFLYDLSYYWMHRLHHEVKILWATHVVHHHGEEFNLSTALRQTSTGFLWKWVFYLPMLLVGIPPEVFVTVAGINLVYQFWVHTEHIGKLGWLEYIFITPSNHRVHHAQNKEYIDANYGGVFILWDRIFGSFKPELDEVKPIYGTTKPLRSWNPLKANFEVFAEIVRDFSNTKKWSDKFKLVFSPPKWRPSDVEINHPIVRNDLNNFEVYDPKNSVYLKIYGWIQLFFIILTSAFIASSIGSLVLFESYAYALILIASVIVTLKGFESFELNYFSETIKISFLISVLFLSGIFNSNLIIFQVFLLHQSFSLLSLIILFSFQKVKLFSSKTESDLSV